MVKLLAGPTRDAEIDTEEMMFEIDDVFHTHITRENGYTVPHDIIRNFIRAVVSEINSDIQSRRDVWAQVLEEERVEKELIGYLVWQGLYITTLDSRWNRFKFKYLGYVLWSGGVMVLYRTRP